MEDAIVLYASVVHLNSMLVLATFIAKHYPFLRIIILSYAHESAAASVSTVPKITYRRLALPPNLTDNNNPAELLYEIPRLNNPILQAALQEISGHSRIRAVVIDFFCNAAFEVSTSLHLPTYFYVSAGSAFVCMLLYIPTIDDTISADIGDLHDFLDIPGCPTILSSDLPELVFFRRSNVYRHVMDTAKNMRKSSGILTNGFDAIDFRAKQALTHGLCVADGPTPPVYLVGPLVGECNSSVEHECLRWLDNQPSKSVIFLCFGRDGLLSLEQLREVAVGLEKSGYRFLWKATAGEVEFPEGFLERTKERGLVVKSWAPQKEVLSHDAVAGFVTHCGRSSVLEALCSGVPMIGWPLYAEQRMNRVVMVEEMKVALPLEEQADGFVTALELQKRITELMESNKGRQIRHRVAEIKVSAAAATVPENGSSVVALHKFIDSLTLH